MAFDDGTPLDAAKLQALETELINIKSSIPKIGSSTTNINVTQNSTVTQKQILSGTTDSINLKPGQQVQVNLKYNADSKPTAIVMSPVKWAGSLQGCISWYVEGGSISAQGATAQVYLEKGQPGFGIRFFFIVLCD